MPRERCSHQTLCQHLPGEGTHPQRKADLPGPRQGIVIETYAIKSVGCVSQASSVSKYREQDLHKTVGTGIPDPEVNTSCPKARLTLLEAGAGCATRCVFYEEALRGQRAPVPGVGRQRGLQVPWAAEAKVCQVLEQAIADGLAKCPSHSHPRPCTLCALFLVREEPVQHQRAELWRGRGDPRQRSLCAS